MANTTDVDDDNLTGFVHLSDAAAAVGISLASIAIIYCLISWVFVFVFRYHRIVSVGQPEFLYLVCFGAMLTSLAVFFMTFDESYWPVEKLDRFCIATIWCEYPGPLIVYMALATKLWRVRKVTQMTRGLQVQVHHVMGPFVITALAALAILIAYTVVHPPMWERSNVTNLVGDQFTMGMCTEHLSFVVPLDVLILVSAVLALWMSCKTRHLPEDISDSRHVTRTLIAHITISIVAFIMFAISTVNKNYNWVYLSDVVVTIGFSVASIAFLITPKMLNMWQYKRTGQLPRHLTGGTRVTGVSFPVTDIQSLPTVSTAIGGVPDRTKAPVPVFPENSSAAPDMSKFSEQELDQS